MTLELIVVWHVSITHSLSSSIYPSLSLCVCLSFPLSLFLSIHLSLYLSLSLFPSPSSNLSLLISLSFTVCTSKCRLVFLIISLVDVIISFLSSLSDDILLYIQYVIKFFQILLICHRQANLFFHVDILKRKKPNR